MIVLPARENRTVRAQPYTVCGGMQKGCAAVCVHDAPPSVEENDRTETSIQKLGSTLLGRAQHGHFEADCERAFEVGVQNPKPIDIVRLKAAGLVRTMERDAGMHGRSGCDSANERNRVSLNRLCQSK